MTAEPEYFIGLQTPVVIRKGLLEAAKESVTLLKSQYRLREIRIRKALLMQQLQLYLSEISELVDGLEADLPAHNPKQMPESVQRAVQRIEERQKMHKQEPKKAPKKAAPPPKPVSQPKPKSDEQVAQELRDLEAKLSSIESKLNKL